MMFATRCAVSIGTQQTGSGVVISLTFIELPGLKNAQSPGRFGGSDVFLSEMRSKRDRVRRRCQERWLEFADDGLFPQQIRSLR
jgi:hypothetical protein